MKKILLTQLCASVYAALPAQVFKMDRVWNLGDKYLFCKKNLETPGGYSFVLCDVKYYDEDNGNPFMSLYLEGSPGDMNNFLESLVSFVEKYRYESGIVAEINGVRVYRTRRILPGIYLFEADGRHFGGYRDKQLTNLHKDFVDYCKRENIPLN